MTATDRREASRIEAQLRRVFAYRLRHARARACMTLAAVEAKTGLSQAFLMQVEDGDAELTLNTIGTLASALKSEASDLLLSPMALVRDH